MRLINRIYYNALRSLQRTNGGAGCQTCLTPDRDVLKVFMYEADFCCSMRLAEGLLALKELSYIETGDGITVVFNENSHAAFPGGVTVAQGFVRGREGSVTFTVENKGGAGRLKIYVPRGVAVRGAAAEGGFVVLPLSTGKVTLSYTARPRTERVKGRVLRFLGDMLLTKKGEKGGYTPVTNCFKLKNREEEEALVQRI